MQVGLSRRAALTAVGAAAMVVSFGAARAEADALDRLLTLIGERLDVMPDVARHKFNTGSAVDDLPREAQVLAQVTAQAESAGAPRALAERFFQAQIDAAKTIQRARIAAWQAEGRGPFAAVPDLATQIRPKLDALTPKLIAALRDAAPSLAYPDVAARLEAAAAAFGRRSPGDDAAFRIATAALAG